MKRHNYKLTKKNFDKLIGETNITIPVSKVLEKILVNGESYYDCGYNRGFIWKKIARLRGIAEKVGVSIYRV